MQTKSRKGTKKTQPRDRESRLGVDRAVDGKPESTELPTTGVGGERLLRLFSLPRSPAQLIAGLRALGFTAESVQLMTRAKSRDVIYAWAAGRTKPNAEQAKRLDEVRRILALICRNRELGADAAWMLFNARFGSMDPDGPTAIELISQGEAPLVMSQIQSLVRDDRNGGGGGDLPSSPNGPSGDAPANSALRSGY